MEGKMYLIFGILAVVSAFLGVYLFLIDAEAITQLGEWFNSVLVTIGAWDQPFAKGVLLLGLALAFAIIAVIFYRKKMEPKS